MKDIIKLNSYVCLSELKNFHLRGMKTSDFDSMKEDIFAMMIVGKFAKARNVNIAICTITFATVPAG